MHTGVARKLWRGSSQAIYTGRFPRFDHPRAVAPIATNGLPFGREMGSIGPAAVSKRTSIWMDVDPGHDDAMALILGAYDPRLHLLGVSTIAGNQTVHKTTSNALRVLKLIGKLDGEVVVVRGLEKPLVRELIVCPEIHGESGLEMTPGGGRSSFQKIEPDWDMLDPRNPIVVMRDTILTSEKPVTIVATAALTNIAALITVFPECLRNVAQVIFLGGSVKVGGNITPAAEFNVMVDPHAYHILLRSGVKVAMIPLDVSHKVLVRKKILEKLPKSPFGRVVHDLLTYFSSSHVDFFGDEFREGPPLHDPLAVAYVADPSLFQTHELNVKVEMESPLTIGMTSVDIHQLGKQPPNATVAMDVDIDGFWKLFLDSVKRADPVACNILGSVQPISPVC